VSQTCEPSLGAVTVPAQRAPETATVRVPGPVGRPRDWRATILQVLIVGAGVAAYFLARGFTEANHAHAVRNARHVVSFEKWAHLYHEHALQEWAVAHELLIDVLNWVYIWGHWPVIIVTLLWLVHHHPGPYRLLRNAMLVSGLIGVVIFVLFPVAPPRLAGLGLVDTVTLHSHASRVRQPPAFVNQYAAVPSLHVGWSLLIGIFVYRNASRRSVRALGILSPIAMTAAVVLTANHYLIDAVLGAMVALIGLFVASRFTRTT
jgi:hypothetical protein